MASLSGTDSFVLAGKQPIRLDDPETRSAYVLF